MSDFKLINSLTPKTLYANFIPATETTIYTSPAGTFTKISDVILTNTTASTVNNVRVSRVPTGGTASDANRVFYGDMAAESVAPTAGQTTSRVSLGELGYLGPGDFLSVNSGTASAVSINISGSIGSNTAGGAAAGVVLDAVGSAAGRSAAATTATQSITVGTLANRYLLAQLAVSHDQWMDWTAWDTLTVSSSNGGALTRLVSANVGPSGQREGSVHIFGLANPASGAHTLTATANDSTTGTDGILLGALSYSGVGGVSGAVSHESTATGALNLAVTSATNNRVVFAGAGEVHSHRDLAATNNKQIRWYNSDAFAGKGDILIVADAAGASTVTWTNTNTTTLFGAVAIDLDAA